MSALSPARQVNELEAHALIARLHNLQPLYQELNQSCFDGILPRCQLVWSNQLTSSAGRIRPEQRIITLSVPLLIVSFLQQPGTSFLACGLEVSDAESAVREILKHEMIHLWLYVQGLPCGHTAAFRAKARELGQPSITHRIEARPRVGDYIMQCPHCGLETVRRRRPVGLLACKPCCSQFNGGKYDERFRLKLYKLQRAKKPTPRQQPAAATTPASTPTPTTAPATPTPAKPRRPVDPTQGVLPF